MVRRSLQHRRSEGAERGADRDAPDDREAEGAPETTASKCPRASDAGGQADEDQGGAVVEEALPLHDRREPVGTRTLRNASEHAHGVGDRRGGRRAAARRRTAEPEPGRRDRRRAEQGDGHARYREGEDGPARARRAIDVREERALEDEDRQEDQEDDLRIDGRLGEDVHEDEEEAGDDQGYVVRDPDALRPIAAAEPAAKTIRKRSSWSRMASPQRPPGRLGPRFLVVHPALIFPPEGACLGWGGAFQ